MVKNMSGPCFVTIKDRDGNVIMEGIVNSYTLTVQKPQPIYMMGAYSPAEYVGSPTTHFEVRGVMGHPQPKKEHVHSWKLYDGFTERYEYCDCGEKR